MSTIFLYLWLTTGFRIVKLLMMILSRWKETLSTKISYLFDSKTPILWTYYKRRSHRGHSKNKQRRFTRVDFTLVFNVDDKVNKSNSNSMFDTNATFVVCDNSANTHICNNRSMFTDFKETNKGIMATIGGKLNRPSGISTIKWKWKNDNGVMHEELIEQVIYFPNLQFIL